jgi:hypothetical protein
MQIFPAIVGDHKDRRKENIPHLSQVFFGGAHSETFSEKKKPLTHLSGEGMVRGRIAAPPILLLDYVKLRISPLFSGRIFVLLKFPCPSNPKIPLS